MEPLNQTIPTPPPAPLTPVQPLGQKMTGIKPALPQNNWLRVIIIIIVLFIIAYYLLDFFGIFGLFILLLAAFLGFWFPRWYMRHKNPSTKVAAIFAWLNIILWVLPPLGLLGSIATWRFAKYYPTAKKKYLILAAIGLALTIINGVWGALSS